MNIFTIVASRMPVSLEIREVEPPKAFEVKKWSQSSNQRQSK